MSDVIRDAVAERAATLSTYATSGSVAVAGLTMQEWFGLVGVGIAILTFFVNSYYKEKTRQHQIEMQRITAGKAANSNDCDAG